MAECVWRRSKWPYDQSFELEKCLHSRLFLHPLLFLLHHKVRLKFLIIAWFEHYQGGNNNEIIEINHSELETNILYALRNHSKKGALKGIHFGWILSRTVCDALGRTSIVFVWLTLMDADGNFQPLLVISSYYGIVLILIFYNIVFNTSEITCSSEYFIG